MDHHRNYPYVNNIPYTQNHGISNHGFYSESVDISFKNGITEEQHDNNCDHCLYCALYDYEAQGEDELNLTRGDKVEVLSTDVQVSGDEGWWTGKIGTKVGIFPSNFVVPVSSLHSIEPRRIAFEELELDEVIGAGGFGKVFKANWRGQEVAVKAARQNVHTSTSVTLRSVLEEARLFWLLSHQNIIQLIGICLEEPTLCLILEYAKGGPVSRVLQEKKQISPSIITDWAIQIAKGMKYLHVSSPISLIHRDLKSSNVLISECIEDGLEGKTLKITDFGLAREHSETTLMSAAGTYAWMSPEVIKTSLYSKAADVWSYGVVLWELLTSEIPYNGIDGYTIAYGVAVGKLSLHVPDTVPQPWKELLELCWDPDPHKRPDFNQMLTKLDDIMKIKFTVKQYESFHTLQERWKTEIAAKVKEIRIKEKDLHSREEEIGRAAMDQQIRAEDLKRKEEELNCREFNIMYRELSAILMNKLSPHLPGEKSKPTPRKRKGKFKKMLLNKQELISPPKNFRHNISVDPNSRVVVNHGENPFTSPISSRLKSIPMAETNKGKTWGPSSSLNRTRNASDPGLLSAEKHWSRSVPSLDKSKSLVEKPSRKADESYHKIRGKRNKGFNSNMESLLYNVASVLATVPAGYDIRISNVAPVHPSLLPKTTCGYMRSMSSFHCYCPDHEEESYEYDVDMLGTSFNRLSTSSSNGQGECGYGEGATWSPNLAATEIYNGELFHQYSYSSKDKKRSSHSRSLSNTSSASIQEESDSSYSTPTRQYDPPTSRYWTQNYDYLSGGYKRLSRTNYDESAFHHEPIYDPYRMHDAPLLSTTPPESVSGDSSYVSGQIFASRHARSFPYKERQEPL